VGLLYDSKALDDAEALVSDWTPEEREYLRTAVTKDALQTPFRDGTVQDVAIEMVRIAKEGLTRRGANEENFVDGLMDMATSGVTRADEMLGQVRQQVGDEHRQGVRRLRVLTRSLETLESRTRRGREETKGFFTKRKKRVLDDEIIYFTYRNFLRRVATSSTSSRVVLPLFYCTNGMRVTSSHARQRRLRSRLSDQLGDVAEF
jgi:hypothetical protein